MESKLISLDRFKYLNNVELKLNESDWEALTPEEKEIQTQILIDEAVAQGRKQREDEITMVLIIFACVIIFTPIYIYMKLPRWKEEYPLNFNEYIEKYPHCFSHGEVTCYKCGSNKQSNYTFEKGWLGNESRSVNCHTCGAHLYRIEND